MIRGSESLLYDAVYAGIQDQVYVMKPAENTYVYEFLNESAKKATGLSDQVIGQTFEEVFSQNIASVLITEYDKVMQKKDIIIYEDEYVVDNQTRHSNITLSPILNKQGNVDVIVGVVKDITNQKNAERELSHLWNELNKSKKRYQSLFKDNSDAIISFDLEGRITNGNPQVQDITGFKPIELIGKTCNAILDEESTAKLLNLINQPSSGKTAQLNVEITNRSNQIKSVSVKVSPLILNQKIQGTYAIFHDLTKEIETIKKWEESEERFRIIAEHAHDMISLLNYQGRIIYASPSYKRIVGFDNQEYTGKIFLYHIHPEDQERLQEIVVNSIKNGTPFSLQTRHYTMDGSYIWVEANGAPVFDKTDNFKHMVVLARDITMQKVYEKQLEHNATHDYLTGLPNRRLFKSKLTERLCHPSSDSLAVLMLDIDDFKSINDTFGHDIGDAVIVEFGKKVSQYLGDNDIVARLGGDEFIVLLYSISYAEKAEQFANNIKEVMKKPWGLEIGNIDVTTSIGITITNSEDNKDAFQLMKQADIALYEAKNDGKNGFYIYQDDTV